MKPQDWSGNSEAGVEGSYEEARRPKLVKDASDCIPLLALVVWERTFTELSASVKCISFHASPAPDHRGDWEC